MLTFVHLSDLHLRADRSNGVHDLDADVRNALRNDLSDLLTGGPTDAILVSGDIAYAGKEQEYGIAREFFKRICEVAGCRPEDVLMIPGNHDVDQQLQAGDTQGALLRRELLERVDSRNHDDFLRNILENDPAAGDRLLAPLDAFNKFARGVECEVRRDRPFWERDFQLGSGYVLRIRGVNSTWTSQKDDDKLRLFVGNAAVTMSVADGVAYLFMCHHPPQWLRDQDAIEPILRERANIQLFGHRHTHNVEQQGLRSLRVFSGALHPDRHELGWEPRYNILKVGLDTSQDAPALHIRVYARVWNRAGLRFVSDNLPEDGIHRYTFPFARPLTAAPRPTASTRGPGKAEAVTTPKADSPKSHMDARRRAIFLFYELSDPQQEALIRALDLPGIDPRVSEHPNGFDDVFLEVERASRWPIFWSLLAKEHPDADDIANPFLSS